MQTFPPALAAAGSRRQGERGRRSRAGDQQGRQCQGPQEPDPAGRQLFRWLPGSDIAVWIQEYSAARDGRSREQGIVAVDPKLLVALWRYAAIDLVPAGAIVSAAA